MKVIRITTKGWYEHVGNIMCFKPHEFNMPQIVDHLSNHMNLLTSKREKKILNANVTLYWRKRKLKKRMSLKKRYE